MSAVPKKKLCWNCEGNIARDINNCPYCGVYLQPAAVDDDSAWNPSYRPHAKMEEIPSPLYQIQSEVESDAQESSESQLTSDSQPLAWSALFEQLKSDVFPILFLMMGSIFFLFGVVLLLFSQNGTFTLQWQEKDGLYFLLFALPLVGFGWIFLQRLDSND